MGRVLVREECRVRPKMGRIGEGERTEKWGKEGGGMFWVVCGQRLITSAG